MQVEFEVAGVMPSDNQFLNRPAFFGGDWQDAPPKKIAALLSATFAGEEPRGRAAVIAGIRQRCKSAHSPALGLTKSPWRPPTSKLCWRIHQGIPR